MWTWVLTFFRSGAAYKRFSAVFHNYSLLTVLFVNTLTATLTSHLDVSGAATCQLCLQQNKNVEAVFMNSHSISCITPLKDFICFWVSPQLTLLQRNFPSHAPWGLQPHSQTPTCPSPSLPSLIRVLVGRVAASECWWSLKSFAFLISCIYHLFAKT